MGIFEIEIKRLYWIDRIADNPEDLFLHGGEYIKNGFTAFWNKRYKAQAQGGDLTVI